MQNAVLAYTTRFAPAIATKPSSVHDRKEVATLRKALSGAESKVYSETQLRERSVKRVDIGNIDDGEAGISQVNDCRKGGSLGSAVHRLIDIVFSLALLILALPLMLLTALLVLLDSPGPVLYRQERLGLNGDVFTLLKFRSMCRNAETRGPVWAAEFDTRVTRVGSFIRLARIDELPQLMNVLRGEMSLVGPRPERLHFVSQLELVLPLYRERMQIKPGLTGWAQVNYPYGASIEDARAKLSYDLYYVRYRSLYLDVMILFATVPVVLFRRGAR